MRCDEIAATLQQTLLHQRDPQWVREACHHAARCPECARLLELHRVEERQPVAPLSPGQFLVGLCKFPTLFVGALILASAYLVPGAGQFWFSNLLTLPDCRY